MNKIIKDMIDNMIIKTFRIMLMEDPGYLISMSGLMEHKEKTEKNKQYYERFHIIDLK